MLQQERIRKKRDFQIIVMGLFMALMVIGNFAIFTYIVNSIITKFNTIGLISRTGIILAIVCMANVFVYITIYGNVWRYVRE